jgi:hypothetical protein
MTAMIKKELDYTSCWASVVALFVSSNVPVQVLVAVDLYSSMSHLLYLN